MHFVNAGIVVGLLIALVALPIPRTLAQGATGNVSGEGFGTIQGAIDAAEDGATINVPPGRYTESVVIDGKHVTLIGGTGKGEQPVIEPGPGRPAFTIRNVPRSDEKDVVIQNFTIEAAVEGGWPGAINVEDGPLSLIGNRLTNTGTGTTGMAVWTAGYDPYRPHWIWLHGNEFQSFFKVLEVDRAPVWLQNNIVRNTRDAFVLRNVDGCLVEGNDLRNPPPPSQGDDPYENSVAITTVESTRCHIRDNFVQYYHAAIAVAHGWQIQIECNELLDDRRGSGGSIGLTADPAEFLSDYAVWDNDWRRFAYGLVDKWGHSFVVNNIDVSAGRVEPAVTGITSETVRTPLHPVVAPLNWWDHPSGPSQRGQGQGSGVFWRDDGSEVFFHNWLTEEPDLKAECAAKKAASALNKETL